MLARIGQNFAAQILSLVLSIVDRLVVAGLMVRSWGADGFADWAVLFATAGLITMLECGHNIYVGNSLQKAHAEGNTRTFHRTFAVALWCGGAIFVVLTIIGAAFIFVADLTSETSLKSMSPDSGLLVIALVGMCLVSRAARAAIAQTYRGRSIYAIGTLVGLVLSFITMVVTIVALLAGAGAVVVGAIFLVCELVFGWGLMVFDLKRRFPDLSFMPTRPSGGEVLNIFNHLKWFAFHIITPQAWLHAPVLLLGMTGVAGAQIASFVLLRTLTGMSRQMSTLLSLASGVELTSSYHRDGSGSITEKLVALGLFISVASALVAALLLVFGESFLALWTGERELFDAVLLGWLLFALMLFVFAVPIKTMLSLANEAKIVALANVIQLAVGLPAFVLLAAVFGVSGGSAGLALGEFAGGIVALSLLASPVLPLQYVRYFCTVAMASLLAFGWCYLVGKFTFEIVEPSNLMRFTLSVVLVCLVGMLPCLWLAAPLGLRRRLRAVQVWQG